MKSVPRPSVIIPLPDRKGTMQNLERPQERPNASSSMIRLRKSLKRENASETLWNGSSRGGTHHARPYSQMDGLVITCQCSLMHYTKYTTLHQAESIIKVSSRTSQKCQRDL